MSRKCAAGQRQNCENDEDETEFNYLIHTRAFLDPSHELCGDEGNSTFHSHLAGNDEGCENSAELVFTNAFC